MNLSWSLVIFSFPCDEAHNYVKKNLISVSVVSMRTGQRDDDDGHDESDGLRQRTPSRRSLDTGGSSSVDLEQTAG